MIEKDKLDELFDSVVRFALAMLEKNGEFFPIGGIVHTDGEVRPVAIYDEAERPESQTVIDGLTDLFRRQAAEGEIAASAIAFDARIRLPDSGEDIDAIVTRIRAKGYARDVNLPYTLATKGFLKKIHTLEVGQLSASEGMQDVFV